MCEREQEAEKTKEAIPPRRAHKSLRVMDIYNLFYYYYSAKQTGELCAAAVLAATTYSFYTTHRILDIFVFSSTGIF